MSVRIFIKLFLNKSARSRISHPPAPRARPRLEVLETRLVPYSVSGNAWPHPELVTLSFVPDGTNLGGSTSNLFSTFNAKFGSPATWQNAILKGAQMWAQQTNLNFSLISDNGADTGSGNYQQGNPGMGDIRFAGFNFASSPLAMAYMPPSVNNYSIAGDIAFNTGQTFNINTTYDLFTVAMHEMGHALGLYHSDAWGAVMNANYTTKMTGLSSDDIAGIRNIYSSNNPRSYDAFGGANNSFTAATNLTGLLNANSTVLETGLDLTTTAQKDYFTITAPSTTASTMTVTVQSSGLSLLAPTLTVYNGSQAQLATVSGAGHYGTTLSLTINGVTAGSTYFVKVAGADSTAFGTGDYALTLNLGTGASATVPQPNTQTANGNPASGGGGQGFNPGIIQSALGGLLGGGLLGGGLLGGVSGILKDAAGVFDLLEVPGVNSLSHPPGCCCPNCRQSLVPQQMVLAGADTVHDNIASVAVMPSQTQVDPLDATGSQAPEAVILADPAPAASAWQNLADRSSLGGFFAGLTSSQREQRAGEWWQACEAYFADPN